MFYNLVAGEGNPQSVEDLAEIAQKMNPQQIAEARSLAKNATLETIRAATS